MSAIAFAYAFSAGLVLVEWLAKPWRKSSGAHWTERARLGFAPNLATLLILCFLPAALAVMGGIGAGAISPGLSESSMGFWVVGLASLAGAMVTRYQWLREFWGNRVTLGSWLGGCLVVMLVIPHLVAFFILLFVMPPAFGPPALLTLAAGAVALGVFAFGGGLLSMRVLRIATPAPPWVTEIVQDLAKKMKISGRVQVFQLHWAQVNAMAWVLQRSVGFSRTLLQEMTPEEVRAIAAHELGHLLEPRWVRAVRVLHLLCYLGAVPLLKYGGVPGMVAGYFLILGLMLAFRRFGRGLEERADRLEREAVGPAAYAESMLKLHQSNCSPAVMPGAQTHPHLYDRLLAGGLQPEFPRPAAPSRARPALAVAMASVAALLLMGTSILAIGVAFRLALE